MAANPRGKRGTSDAPDTSTPDGGGGVAVLDPPAEAEQIPVEGEVFGLSATRPVSDDGFTELAGEKVSYLYDADGKLAGADVKVWREDQAGQTGWSFTANIRWDGQEYHWFEDGQERWYGQHTTRLLHIVDKALATGRERALGGSISP